ncbi:hypothetical protein BAE44_0021024 [Dichanthelium oligosanthes]|uniref:Uncharacterized protein n=1 Tax=Dichanthelium oligosanthes TaxID=888268 RepID=A0A1E5UYM1_9POAL|nr:hypothetical protein BAE44_0021024 [Dichanthelium oligosanthes]
MMRSDMQSSGAAAATVSTPASEKTSTEEQARAIICAAQRAVDGGAGGLSLKKSLEWFLEGRKNKAAAAAAGIQRHLEDSSLSN